MRLSLEEKEIIRGAFGGHLKRYLEYLIEFGLAYGADRLVDVSYAHVHSGMSLYEGDVEMVEEIADSGLRVRVPTTSNVFSADTLNWPAEGRLGELVSHQRKVEKAHQRLGIVGLYTCTPFLAGYLPLKGTHISCFESGVIAHYNAMSGARTNRDGLFSLYAALTGKYPDFGLHRDENRKGTHLFNVRHRLETRSDFSALGYYIGERVDNGIPVLIGEGLAHMDHDAIIYLEAAMATSGSVAMYHIPAVTAEASSVEDAFGRRPVPRAHDVTGEGIDGVYGTFGGHSAEEADFVTLGCPHYSIEGIKRVAMLLQDSRILPETELWVCTSRPVKALSDLMGYTHMVQEAGGRIVCDTCPVCTYFCKVAAPHEIRITPERPIRTMITDSTKMAKYAARMIGCRTILKNMKDAIHAVLQK